MWDDLQRAKAIIDANTRPTAEVLDHTRWVKRAGGILAWLEGEGQGVASESKLEEGGSPNEMGVGHRPETSDRRWGMCPVCFAWVETALDGLPTSHFRDLTLALGICPASVRA